MNTTRTFLKTGTCSEALVNVLDRAFGHPLELEEHGAAPLAGGMVQQGYQCGAIWGMTLAAGAQAHRLFGPGPQAQSAAIRAAQELVDSFRVRNREINCLEITGTDWKKKSQMVLNFLKGGPISCVRLCVKAAPAAFTEINASLSQEDIDSPSSPVSCAAMLLEKLGMPDLHSTMAAGFAGGIGLCGGGCGALGAALWIIGMEGSKANLGYNDINSKADETIKVFLEHSDYEFECSGIIGRQFEDVADHADHLRNGGCSEIIEALATDLSP